jgi:hypothetical protein
MIVSKALVCCVQQQPPGMDNQRTRVDAAVQLLLLPCDPKRPAPAASPLLIRAHRADVRVWSRDQRVLVQQQWGWPQHGISWVAAGCCFSRAAVSWLHWAALSTGQTTLRPTSGQFSARLQRVWCVSRARAMQLRGAGAVLLFLMCSGGRQGRCAGRCCQGGLSLDGCFQPGRLAARPPSDVWGKDTARQTLMGGLMAAARAREIGGSGSAGAVFLLASGVLRGWKYRQLCW